MSVPTPECDRLSMVATHEMIREAAEKLIREAVVFAAALATEEAEES